MRIGVAAVTRRLKALSTTGAQAPSVRRNPTADIPQDAMVNCTYSRVISAAAVDA